MIKKSLVLLLILSTLPLVSASLTVEKTILSDSIITEINNTALVNFKLTNTGATDDFKFYSTVGVRFDPSDYFTIESGKTKEFQVKVYVTSELMQDSKTYSFQYKIEGRNSGIQSDEMVLRIFRFKDVFDINSYNIALDADSALVYFRNLANYNFPAVEVTFHSAFFDFTKQFELSPLEKKEFTVELDKTLTKKLVAGDYTLTADVKAIGLSNRFENTFKFIEKSNIISKDSISGIIIRTSSFERKNEGNLPVVVQIKLKKNIITRLFTTFNIEPQKVERSGITINYLFQKEVKPDEDYIVRARTSFVYPLLLLLLIIVIAYLVKFYSSSDLVVKKQAHFVKTKGGEFALKVSVTLKAKKYVEKIKVIDKLPPMVKLHDQFSSIKPSRIDETNRRLEWNLEALQQYEERVFSYIIYSKVGVVGRFELPKATALFESQGKVHETLSNTVFFLTNTPKSV